MKPVDPSLSDADRRHLARAVALAEEGRGHVHPNPVAGCVLVRDGAVVAEAFHAEYGGPHAEAAALEAAGPAARGSTAYVSLEPCAHHGKTPPCAKALVAAGVTRVVFGVADPGEGAGGARRLLEAGVRVEGPALTPEEGRLANPAFFHVHTHGAPWVAVKLAMTLDGRIAGGEGQRTAVTGPEAHARVHRLRREFDGILVGANTARVDDPLLTVRDGLAVPRPPARIVVDRTLSLDPGARLLATVSDAPVRVYGGPDADPGRERALTDAGATVVRVPEGPGGLDLAAVLADLWSQGRRALLCEGGGRLAASLLEGGHARRLYLFVAPRVAGPQGVPAFPTAETSRALEGWTPLSAVETFGPDVLITWER